MVRTHHEHARGTTLALDACEWDQESYCSSYSSSKEATIRTIQRVCRTMATPGDESVKEQRCETEEAGQSGGPGDGGMIYTSGGVTGHSGGAGTKSAGERGNSTKRPFG